MTYGELGKGLGGKNHQKGEKKSLHMFWNEDTNIRCGEVRKGFLKEINLQNAVRGILECVPTRVAILLL